MEKEDRRTVPLSRSEHYSAIIEEMKRFSISDVKRAMRTRYKGEDRFDRLDLYQLEDLLNFLRGAGTL